MNGLDAKINAHFPGLVVRAAGQIAGELAPGGEQAALEHFPLVVHLFHEAPDLALVLSNLESLCDDHHAKKHP